MAAKFIYPQSGNYSLENNKQMINTFDTLYVQYNSSWSSLNLTLFCLQGATSSNYQYWNVVDNPILADGVYKLGTIESIKFSINQYPTNCHMKLTEYGNNDNGTNGQNFWVTSDSGAKATTFQPTSTSSGSAATTTQSAKTTQTANAGATTKLSSKGTADPTGSSSAQTSSASSPSSSSASSSLSSSGLSSGAKAGIGVGVAAAVLIILALLFVIWRMRRSKNDNATGNAHEKAELPANTYNMETRQTKDQKVAPGAPPYSHEVDGATRAELGSEQRPQELPS